jgi:hypothetical protein
MHIKKLHQNRLVKAEIINTKVYPIFKLNITRKVPSKEKKCKTISFMLTRMQIVLSFINEGLYTFYKKFFFPVSIKKIHQMKIY